MIDAVHPTISVIMPNYNGGMFLRSAIKSVLSQSWQDLELIIVDDGSTDSSKEILKQQQIQDQRVRVMFLNHGGIVTALNTGIETAKGSFIARMDSDDYMMPNRLECQLDFLQSHPNTLCGTNAWLCDPKMRLLGSLNPPETHEDILKSCLSGMASHLMHPTLMASKQVFEELGGYREQYRHIEDLDLYLRASSRGFSLKNLTNVIGLKYRLHAKSISNQKVELQMRLKHELLSDIEPQGKLRPDWDGLARAEAMLPRSRSDFYRRWGMIARNHHQRSLALRYLVQSLFTPPFHVSKTVESLKLIKGSFRSRSNET